MIDCLPVCCLLRRGSGKDERDLASEKEVAAGKVIEGKSDQTPVRPRQSVAEVRICI